MRPHQTASQDATSELLGPMWRVQVLMWLLTLIAAIAANRSASPIVGVPWMSALQVPLLVALAAYWPGRQLPRTRAFWSVLALHVGTAVAVGLALGNSWRALAIACGAVLYALVVGVLHRATCPHWVPRSPGGVIVLTLIAFLASPIPLWVAGYPGVDYGVILREPHVALLATERGSIATMIGLNTFLVLFYAPRAAAPWKFRPFTPVIVLITLVAAVGVSLRQHPEVAWTLALGPLAAALTMTPRMVALLLIAMRLVTLKVPFVSDGLTPLVGIPPGVFIDMLIAFTVQTALAVAIGRDEQCRLDNQLLELYDEETRQGAMLDTVLSTIRDGVVVTNPQGEVDVSNTAAEQLLADPSRVLALEAVPGSVTPVVAPDGGTRQVRLFRAPLSVGDEPLTLHLLDDATDELARQRSLETFAGTVAHDLKGPLTAMLGWLDTAEDQLLDDDHTGARAALARADTATGRMDAMIDEYLAFAVIQEGAPAQVDVLLADVVDEIAEVYQGSSVRIETQLPHRVRADAALLRQLFTNLITNSVKYSRPGEGTVIAMISTSRDDGRIDVAVADRGVGIQPGDEDRIFDAFRRSSKDSATHQGVGLGLALCRSIVERHGGSISAANNEWGGATFRFTLPEAAR